jgi:hypothetical protein
LILLQHLPSAKQKEKKRKEARSKTRRRSKRKKEGRPTGRKYEHAPRAIVGGRWKIQTMAQQLTLAFKAAALHVQKEISTKLTEVNLSKYAH